MNAVIPILLKVTLVLAIAGLAAALLTRAAASVRHLIWLAAIVAVLLLPAAAWLAPDWTPVREVALTASSTPRIVVDVVAGAAFPLPGLGSFLIGIWLAGAGFVSLRFVSSHRKAAALAAQSSAFLEDGSVRISGEIAIPLVCGILRPVIVLPETARAWPGERLRVVLAPASSIGFIRSSGGRRRAFAWSANRPATTEFLRKVKGPRITRGTWWKSCGASPRSPA
jgi:beta-lactamase regulating signal transducer with metallopeptidase domain